MENVYLDGYINFATLSCSDDLLSFLPWRQKLELDNKKLVRCELIGSGFYGNVYRGCLFKSNEPPRQVAIKTPKYDANITLEDLEKQRNSIRAEIKILDHIGTHVNVLNLYGAVTTSLKDFCMVTEYCLHRGLDVFLATRRDGFFDQICAQGTIGVSTKYSTINYKANFSAESLSNAQITTSDLLSFALQIGNGMDFLHRNKIIHRDLALRNILLTEDLIVKIADFGLSRKVKDDTYAKDTEPNLPFRWSAPEALTSKPTPIEADQWTFGILLWELFKLGAIPYDGKNQYDMLSYLNAGKRLDHPEYAPKELSIPQGIGYRKIYLVACIALLVGLIVATLVSAAHILPKSYQNHTLAITVAPTNQTTEMQSNQNHILAITVTSTHQTTQMPERKLVRVFVGDKDPELWDIKRILNNKTNARNETFPGNGRNYLIGNVEVNWTDAQRICQEWDGHLASVLDDNENQFISGRYKKNDYVWIGFHYNESKNAFEWTGGSSSSYVNWEQTPSEGHADKKRCAILRVHNKVKYMKWLNEKCTGKHKFICKQSK
uniref:Uncharacterized protein n=1 Tax=Plectus sambesii TaxID=2011161 RepID=A0A914WZC5_9BILA